MGQKNSKPNLLIRYRFKGNSNFEDIWVSRFQYENLRELPVIEMCEIISGFEKPIGRENNVKKLISQ